MLICFAGMVTMTLSSARHADAADISSIDDTDGSRYSSAQLTLGYSLIFMNSWIFASNCVLNRALKTVPLSIVVFWHGTCGIIMALVGILIEDWFMASGAASGLRILNYDSRVYLLMVGATVFDTLAVIAQTRAFQSDSSGFVALIGYVAVLYSFLADQVIFHEQFYWLELVAALVILLVTVSASIVRIRQS